MNGSKILNFFLGLIRLIVGVLFIFSGLVKANDPSGLAYKMGEFFEAFASKDHFMPKLMEWLHGYALPFSILMITFEIVAGIAILIGYRYKLFSYLIFLLTLFFTFLTAYALFSGNVKECGCFGDCIKLTAMETFVKDLILLALILVLLLFRNRIAQLFSNKIAGSIMVLTLVFCFGVQWYVLQHLPFKDCLAYKVGNNILHEMTPDSTYRPAVYETKFVYEKGGVNKNFTEKDYPWQDSTWHFVSQISDLVKEAENEPKIHDFGITDYDGNVQTETILNYSGNVFLLFSENITKANTSNIEKLVELVNTCKKNNILVLGLSGSDDIATKEFTTKYHLDIPFYSTDGTVIKTAMRTNPGLMLMHAGDVKGKWSYLDYPKYSTLNLDTKDNAIPLFATAPAVEETTQSH